MSKFFDDAIDKAITQDATGAMRAMTNECDMAAAGMDQPVDALGLLQQQIDELKKRLAELETNPTRDELLTTAAITRSAADISKLALKKAVALEHWRRELGCSAKEGWNN